MAGFGHQPFGLRQVKLVSADGLTSADLPAAMTMSVKETTVSGTLRGNDKTLAAVSIADAAEWELENGGISLEAYAIMTGRTVTTSGTTPNAKVTLSLKAGDVFPYFKVYGKSIGPNGDDTHVKMARCKLLGDGIDGQFSDGKFFTTKCKGSALGDPSTNLVADIVQNETAANLPTS